MRLSLFIRNYICFHSHRYLDEDLDFYSFFNVSVVIIQIFIYVLKHSIKIKLKSRKKQNNKNTETRKPNKKFRGKKCVLLKQF